MAAKKTKWDAATVAKMVANPGNRSKIPTQYLPDKYKKIRERNQWTPGRVAAAVANPGTRANVPTGLLPDKYRKVREQNERFGAPITPGSSQTYGDVARQRKAAETLEFGADPVGKAQANEAQTAAWYDAYKRDLEAHRVRQEGYGQQAVSQFSNMAGTAGQVPPGLSAQNAQVASNAQGVRDQLRAGLGAELASRAANANTVASATEANSGLLKAEAVKKQRDSTQATRDKLGAWRSQFMNSARDSEAKNVLALSIAKDKTAAELAADAAKLAQDDRESRRSANTSRMNNAANNATSRANNAANNAAKKKGTSWLPQASQNSFSDSFSAARSSANDLRNSGMTRAQVKKLLMTGRSASTVEANGKKVKIPSIAKVGNSAALRAALDAVYDGSLSAGTVRELHGRKVQIGPLGVKTSGQLGARRATRLKQNKAAKQALRQGQRIGQELADYRGPAEDE